MGLAKGMMAFMSLSKKCQDELWVIYHDLPRSNKLNFKKDYCRIEKDIITMIDKLLCTPTKGTESSKGSNVTSSVVPEIGADDDSVEEDVFPGLFLDQSTREEIVAKEKEKQKKKPSNESSYPARIDNYNAHKKSIECTLKENKTGINRVLGKGKMCNSMHIHIQSVDWTKESGEKGREGDVPKLSDPHSRNQCRIVVVSPGKDFFEKSLAVLTKAAQNHKLFELIHIHNEEEYRSYKNQIDEIRKGSE